MKNAMNCTYADPETGKETPCPLRPVRRILSAALAVAVAICMWPAIAPSSAQAADYDEATARTLCANLAARFGAGGADGSITNDTFYAALALDELGFGSDVDADAILANMDGFEQTNGYALGAGTLAKYILALDAAGCDVTALPDQGTTRDLVAEMEALITTEGMPDVYSLVYILPVYSVAAGSDEMRDAVLEALLGYQITDTESSYYGLFGEVFSEGTDYEYWDYTVQTTAQAVLALAPFNDEFYEDGNEHSSDLRNAITSAYSAVGKAQTDDGGFYYSPDYGTDASDFDTSANALAAVVAYDALEHVVRTGGGSGSTDRVSPAVSYILGCADTDLAGFNAAGTWNETMSAAAAFYGLAVACDVDIAGALSINGAKVTLAQGTYTYSGKACTPAVRSVVLNGRTLQAGTDYTVAYAAGCTNVG
ncbi:MAG: hypothetical protein LUD25_03225, partial [Coriobacteriaceae bacterium]|nr:hypothetical protein [Coriobacteriaceae bacterium]